MRTKSLRKHRAILEKTEPIFKGNPVLSLGICLPFVVVPSMTLKSGVLLSLFMFIATVIPVALYSSMGRTAKQYRFVISTIVSTLLVTAFSFATRNMFPDFYLLVGVYVILFGVNGLTTYCQERCEGESVGKNIIFSLKACTGYSLVVCFVSFIREFLALRTIWDHPVELIPFKLTGVAFPFFGFIFLGFLSAFFRTFERWIEKRLLVKSKRGRKEVTEDAK